MRLRPALLAVALCVAAGLAACSAKDAGAPAQGPDGPGSSAPAGCGPVTFADVRGIPPGYVSGPVAGFPNDGAACSGWWLPRTGTRFVPQGLAVRGRTAWVSGYDGGGPVGSLYCRVLEIDLRSGRLIDERGPVGGRIGLRDPVDCRHGGGLSLDEHGLWLTEKRRLWLLDPSTLATERAWADVLPVWGSYVLHDGRGRLGLAGYSGHGPTTVHWFDPDDLLAPGVIEVTASMAVARTPAPADGQGAFVAAIGGGGGRRTWFVRSDTRCGVLDGGPRRHLGFLPGAEGAAVAGRRLWVVSESTAAPYFRQGGRPVVPQLVRFDLSGLAAWTPAACSP